MIIIDTKLDVILVLEKQRVRKSLVMRSSMLAILSMFWPLWGSSLQAAEITKYSYQLSCHLKKIEHATFSYQNFDLYLLKEALGSNQEEPALIDLGEGIDKAQYKGIHPSAKQDFFSAELTLPWQNGAYVISFSRGTDGQLQGILPLILGHERIDVAYYCDATPVRLEADESFQFTKQLACSYENNLPYQPSYVSFIAYNQEANDGYDGQLLLKYEQNIDEISYKGWAPSVANLHGYKGTIGYIDVPYGHFPLRLAFLRNEDRSFGVQATVKIARANLKFSYRCHYLGHKTPVNP